MSEQRRLPEQVVNPQQAADLARRCSSVARIASATTRVIRLGLAVEEPGQRLRRSIVGRVPDMATLTPDKVPVRRSMHSSARRSRRGVCRTPPFDERPMRLPVTPGLRSSQKVAAATARGRASAARPCIPAAPPAPRRAPDARSATSAAWLISRRRSVTQSDRIWLHASPPCVSRWRSGGGRSAGPTPAKVAAAVEFIELCRAMIRVSWAMSSIASARTPSADVQAQARLLRLHPLQEPRVCALAGGTTPGVILNGK